MQQTDQQDDEVIEISLDDEPEVVAKPDEFSFAQFTPQRVKEQYYQFLEELATKHSDKTKQQLIQMIAEAEKQNNHRLFGGFRVTSGSQDKLETYEIRKLRTNKQIGIASEEEINKLAILEHKFNSVFQEIVESTFLDRQFVEQSINELLQYSVVLTLTEAAEIMILGPKIEGFDTTLDPRISNEKISEFLMYTFGHDALRKAKLGKISKDDKYMIIVPKDNTFIQKVNTISGQNLMSLDAGNMLLTDSKETFLQAEMIFEGVDSIERLRHIYKIRAQDGYFGGFATINLRSFGIEKPEDFDYLTDLDLSDEDKMQAYILGTIAHEVAHRYESQLSFHGLSKAYQSIIDEEVSDKRSKFVSDYVLKHQEIYNTDPFTIMREDLAETVRIYTTNPNYLKKYYPKRFEFIENNFSFIKPGAIVNIINSINGGTIQ